MYIETLPGKFEDYRQTPVSMGVYFSSSSWGQIVANGQGVNFRGSPLLLIENSKTKLQPILSATPGNTVVVDKEAEIVRKKWPGLLEQLAKD